MPTNPSPPTTRRNRHVGQVKAALEKATPPAWMAKYKKQDAGNGISREWEDRAYWLTRADDEAIDWINAIREVDQKGDEGLLLASLGSDRWPPPKARFHLTELIGRYGLKKKRNGRRRTPSYDVSDETVVGQFEPTTDETVRLKFAVDEVHRRKGMPRGEAIELVAELTRFSEHTVAAALRGSNDALRRLNKLDECDAEVSARLARRRNRPSCGR